jgi:hypothetical protein
MEEYLRRQAGILANAEARLLVTFAEAERAAHAVRRRVRTIGGVVAAALSVTARRRRRLGRTRPRPR